MQQPRRGISSIHRSSYRPVVRSSRTEARSPGLGEAGALLTILQVVVCVVLLVTVFTLQFVDQQRFTRAGELYQAVMGRPEGYEPTGEAVYVGTFGTPITRELLEGYADELLATLPEQLPDGLVGQGGQQPWVPQNRYSGSLALLARADYPTYGVLTSAYGLRTHPLSGAGDYHTGIDIAAPLGADVYAVLPGVVTEVGQNATYGNYIKLSHGKRLTTVYNHCSSILAEQGAVIRQGERIALVGSTGVSTGPHLHLDLLVDGSYTDPMQLYA